MYYFTCCCCIRKGYDSTKCIPKGVYVLPGVLYCCCIEKGMIVLLISVYRKVLYVLLYCCCIKKGYDSTKYIPKSFNATHSADMRTTVLPYVYSYNVPTSLLVSG